ncbi:hypothetical protein C8R44DRAFT_868957 [Mycena epipterygia]|nr:hypothetical protein C8R44DRAFT_868957 [Mycena epipterygia]
MPSLRGLEMTLLGGSSHEFSTLFTTLAEDPSILPALESLTIDKCQTKIELPPLARMLAARTGGMDGVAKLKCFGLFFDHDDLHYDSVDFKQQDEDVELALDQLRSLRSEGLKLEIESSIKWFGRDIDSQMIKAISLDNHL